MMRRARAASMREHHCTLTTMTLPWPEK